MEPLGTHSSEAGDKISRCMSCVQKETTISEFIEHLKKDLETFHAHQFRASLQNSQMRKCQNALTDATLMIGNENYDCKFQNEVQSAFFIKIKLQCTHACVTTWTKVTLSNTRL